jgi:phytoene synthase
MQRIMTDPFGGFGGELDRHDHDRYLATLYAPAVHRPVLAALLAFGLDIARLRETVSQPLLAQIRLQWWRDAFAEIAEGKPPRGHPILTVLAGTRIELGLLDAMLTAREQDWDETPPADLDALRRYAGATGGALAEIRALVLGAATPDDRLATRCVGGAFALTGIIRAIPFHAGQGRVMIPQTVATKFTLDRDSLLAGKDSGPLRDAVALLCEAATAQLAEARGLRRRVSRLGLPVLAEARIAEAYLKRIATLGYDVFDARLAEPDGLAAWRLGLTRLTGRY